MVCLNWIACGSCSVFLLFMWKYGATFLIKLRSAFSATLFSYLRPSKNGFEFLSWAIGENGSFMLWVSSRFFYCILLLEMGTDRGLCWVYCWDVYDWGGTICGCELINLTFIGGYWGEVGSIISDLNTGFFDLLARILGCGWMITLCTTELLLLWIFNKG